MNPRWWLPDILNVALQDRRFKRQAYRNLKIEPWRNRPRYLRNQQSRMDYSTYRKQGLPITSTYVESTVKQINRRMKGTEKFWSQGVEPMLTLVADHLSDTPTLAHFWRNRPQHLTGSRRYQSTAA